MNDQYGREKAESVRSVMGNGENQESQNRGVTNWEREADVVPLSLKAFPGSAQTFQISFSSPPVFPDTPPPSFNPAPSLFPTSHHPAIAAT